MTTKTSDIIPFETARTLHGLFRERVQRTPDAVAYRHCDEQTGQWQDITWAQMATHVARWQRALQGESLQPGERVAVLLRNCREWVMYEQAALGLGLVVVPLYPNDRPENIVYILQNSGTWVLLIEGEEHWRGLAQVRDQLYGLKRIVSLKAVTDPAEPRLCSAAQWLSESGGELQTYECDPHVLATIVYTSGTTGRPKGVMLSHHNILWTTDACLVSVPVFREDVFLSFLPLCHTYERLVGYYLPIMAGATVAYARSIPQLADDLLAVRPTIIVSVPRIYERIHGKIEAQLEEKPPFARKLFRFAIETGWARFLHAQGRGPWQVSFLLWPLLDKLVASKVMAKMGGRLRIAMCGGAPLSLPVAKMFIGLGLNLLQGYGLTEASPTISTNKAHDNDPSGIGLPLRGVEVRIGEDGELLARGPNVMLGYWKNPEATAKAIDADGWLHTGDKARIENGHLYITGRLKEIIVMANGEKVPPADMEMAIMLDPLFEQVMVIGEGKPYLSALTVLSRERWAALAGELGLDPDAPASLQDKRALSMALERIGVQLRGFHAYAQVRRVALLVEPWTVENELLTPTLKMRRNRIVEHHRAEVEKLYEGH
ncbi:MAG: AMP-dependent synthetase/ligase [Pseudomonadota bacterium]